MKSLWILIFLIIFYGNCENLNKFLKVTCSSSGKLCANITCRVKAVSRNVSYLTLSCNLTKTLMKDVDVSLQFM